MSIREELADELHDAMRSGDGPRRDVIRQIETEVARAKSAPGFSGAVDDELYRDVIRSYVKRMDKSRQEYESYGDRGAAMAARLAFEVEYLSRWLPTALDENETRSLVRSTIADMGIHDEKQAGRVIGALMKEHGDRLDGALVNRLVREELAGG